MNDADDIDTLSPCCQADWKRVHHTWRCQCKKCGKSFPVEALFPELAQPAAKPWPLAVPLLLINLAVIGSVFGFSWWGGFDFNENAITAILMTVGCVLACAVLTGLYLMERDYRMHHPNDKTPL